MRSLDNLWPMLNYFWPPTVLTLVRIHYRHGSDRSEGFPRAAYFVPGCDGVGGRSGFQNSSGAVFENFGILKFCSWISRLCGIGRRLRRLQRPGVVSFKAIVKTYKKQISENREIGKIGLRQFWILEMLFLDQSPMWNW